MTYSVYLRHPFTMIISRPTGSEKTTLVKNLIERANKICDPPPEKVLYIYGEYQQIFEKMVGINFIEGLNEDAIVELGRKIQPGLSSTI